MISYEVIVSIELASFFFPLSLEDAAELLTYNRSSKEFSREYSKHSVVRLDDGIRFYLDKDSEVINGGERSEISVFSPYHIGQRVRYSFEFSVPDLPIYNTGWNGRWVLIAQFHDQPNPAMGERWKEFPKRPPPVSFGLFFSEQLFLKVKTKNNSVEIPITLGERVTCDFSVQWNYSDNGEMKGVCSEEKRHYSFYLKDKLLNNDYYHYFKFGIYRDKKIDDYMAVDFFKVNVFKDATLG